METFLLDLFKFVVDHWAMMFIFAYPYVIKVLKRISEFFLALQTIANETHEILKLHDKRLTALESCVNHGSQTL